MKTLTSFLIVVLSCSFALVDTQTFAQDAGGDNANVESNQREEEILQLRDKLMRLERERAADVSPTTHVGAVTAGRSSVNMARLGNGAFENLQAVDALPAQLPTAGYSVASNQQAMPYEQAMSMPTTLPADSSWLGQSMATQSFQYQSAPMVISSPTQPVYTAPAMEYSQPAPIEYSQPAPIVQQPMIVQQAPAPQVTPTIIVNIYQQPPAAQNDFFPSILAPIYGPAPIQVSSPRRGCCLFGRR